MTDLCMLAGDAIGKRIIKTNCGQHVCHQPCRGNICPNLADQKTRGKACTGKRSCNTGQMRRPVCSS